MLNITRSTVSVLVISSLFSLPAFSQTNCAAISDPQAMYDCVVRQRQDNQTLDKSEPLDLGQTPKITDWKKVGPIAGTPATLYYSPGTAKYMKVRDSQTATGSSQVVRVYQMQDFPPQGTGADKVSSTVVTVLYHCQHPNEKSVKFESYSDRMAKGKQVKSTEAPGDKKWGGLLEGDDVIRNSVLRKCPETQS